MNGAVSRFAGTRLTLAAVWIATSVACGDAASVSGSLTQDPQTSGQKPTPVGQVQLGVEVIGDVTFAEQSYQILLDQRLFTLVPNSSAGIVVTAGDHVAQILSPIKSTPTTQCNLIGEAKRSVHVGEGEVVAINFPIECAAVAPGTGIEVTVATRGLFTPSTVTITITGEGQSPLIISDQMPPGVTRFYSVPPGTYQVKASAPACGSFVGTPPTTQAAVVKSGQSVQLRFSLFCIP